MNISTLDKFVSTHASIDKHFNHKKHLENAFDAQDADISYFFESQLAGETQPVEDIHFHPVEPGQMRLSLRYHF